MILKDGNGSTVELTERNTIIKTAHDHEQYTKLRNAVRFHKALGPVGLAPILLGDNGKSIELEYIEENISRADPVDFQDTVRRNAICLLLNLQQHYVIHTDLTEYNYILQQYRICPVDWSEARFAWEDVPNKRMGMDADWLYPSLLKHIPDSNRIVRKWIAIRQHIKDLRGYGTVLDLGCLYGDITAMAASEGFRVVGVDNGMFDKEWQAIAHDIWPISNMAFYEWDIGNMVGYDRDIVLMLSSWSHYIQQYSLEDGINLLARVLNECGILFFENHLYGDGPGHERFKSEEDHLQLFNELGATAVPITTLEVGGRPFSRTVYKVTK
jgi:SAM-dependent methyltransferase